MTKRALGGRPRPRALFARGAFLASLIGVVTVGACGRGEPAPRTAAASNESAQPPVRPSSDSTTPALAAAGPAPAFLATACLRGDPASGARWNVEQVEHSVVRLAARAIATLAPRDSARLAARIARAVDALPSDTTIADFRGLPVVVVDAWRVVVASGDTVVVAHVARRLPMESSPLEESFTLVAVPGVRQGVRDPLLEGWSVREVAREEAGTTREFLEALLEEDGRVSLLFVREGTVGTDGAADRVLELVARTVGTWRLEWSGPVAVCR